MIETMKKLLGILVLGLLLNNYGYAELTREDLGLPNKKPWYKKLPGIDYFEKRKECKETSEHAETTHLEKAWFKNCMDD